MTPLSEQSYVEPIARTLCDGHEIRKAEDGLYIKPARLDGDGEFSITLAELGEALGTIGWNLADITEAMSE